MALKPCVVLVIPERAIRALLRAELIERGHDAVGMHDLAELTRDAPDPNEHGPVGLILVDDEAVRGPRRRLLDRVRQRHPGAPVVLLAGRTAEPQSGPWRTVLLRPTTIGAIVDAIEQLVGPPPVGRRASDLAVP